MYDNIHIGSNVDFCRKNGEILSGKVKWKGSIIHRKGFWIGVELDDQDGKHDGFIHGRRYFQCRPFHGVFVRPSQVRFSHNRIRSRKQQTYRKMSNQSSADETLFLRGKLDSTNEKRITGIALTESTLQQIKNILKETSSSLVEENSHIHRHRKPHSVGAHLTASKVDHVKGGLSSETLQFSPRDLKRSDPSYNYFLSKSCSGTFRSPSSIPVVDRKPAHCSSTEKFYRSKSISRISLNKTL